MQGQQILDALASYVPTLVVRRLANDPSPITTPLREVFPAAVLFTDISGFTPMAERLAQREPEGLEDISRMLNTHFGELIDLVYAHGGEVVKFAGDALLALWPAQSQPQARHDRRDLALSVRRAAQCALSIQRTMHNHEPVQGCRISLRVGVAAGEVSVSHVGGVFSRWELLVAGVPLERVSSAEQHARPGQVLLATEAWEMIKDHCLGAPLDDPAGLFRLDGLSEPLVLYPLPPVSLSPTMSAGLRAYIPGAILSRLAVGQSSWVAELRRVSVLFVKLPDLNAVTLLERSQEVMHALQTAIYHYEGSINKLNVDNKGTTLVAAMGLPPMSHEDDAVRAVQAAQAIQAGLRSLGVNCSIGIATGQAFCGAIGTATRREYTMVGDVVNLAARLMEAAQHDIFCDTATYQAAVQRLEFTPLDAMSIKGKTLPVIAYRPRGPIKAVVRPRTELIGRSQERTALVEKLQALLRGAQKNVVLIEGEAGIGKSRLAEELLRQAQVLSVNSLVGSGDAIEKSTPYHVWRPTLYQLLHLEPGDGPDQRRLRVQQELEHFAKDAGQAERMQVLAPLLNAVLALDLPDNEITAQMSGEVRADNTRELLVMLLQKAARDAPLLLVLEDAHWFDSASWLVVRMVSQQVQPLLMVVTTRPFDGAPPVEYVQLKNDPAAVYFKLSALSHGSTLALTCQRLGVASLPQPVVDFIYEKAEGHPFFSEELAYALRDAGVIEVANGVCRVAPHIDDLRALNFPYTIQGVIVSRVDRLTPQQQLTLKVASVIGRLFAYSTLRDVYPVEPDKPRLSEHLQTLERLDLTALTSIEPDLTYIFKHIITQDVVYNLMLFAQRKQLHQAVAEWYEEQYADDLSPYYPLLVHHWGKAENEQKTLEYLDKAGEQALRDYANQEAVDFFSQALSMVTRSEAPVQVDRVRQAHWERQLGEAHYGLGRMVEGRKHLMSALALVGYSVPNGFGLQVLRLVQQVLRQVLHRLFPRVFLARSRHPGLRMEAADTYSQLAAVYYLSNDTTLLLLSTLSTLNLAERVQVSPELARAYANMSSVASLIPWRKLALLYERRAWEILPLIHRPYEEAYASMVFAVQYSGLGDWERVEAYITSALQVFRQIGDHERISESATILATALGLAGQTQRSCQLFEQILAEAQETDNDLQRAWGMVGRAHNLLRQNEAEQSEWLLHQALDLLAVNTDFSEQVRAYGLLALASLRQGKYETSLRAAQEMLRVPGQSVPTVFSTLAGYAGAAEVYLTLWEGLKTAQSDITTALGASRRLEVMRAARLACKAMHRFARVFPIGLPRAWLYQGWLEKVSGHPRRAQRAWQRSLAAAETLHMTYEMGRACFEIAKTLPPADTDRMRYLQRAVQYFQECQATYDLAQVQTYQTTS